MKANLPSIPTAETAVPLDADLLCGHCSQNLRGVSSTQCPECGHRFDRGRLISTLIPWESRRSIGRFRAYWQTVRLVTFRAGKLWEHRDGITLAAAKSFRRWTVALFFLLIWCPSLYLWMRDAKATSPLSPLTVSRYEVDIAELAQNPWFFGISSLALLLSLGAITGVASYFFQPGRLRAADQRRGVALSYYACAPLAWSILAAPVFAAYAIIDSESGHRLRDAYPTTAIGIILTIASILVILPALSLLVWWWVTARLLGKVHDSKAWAALAAMFLPVLWASVTAVIFFGLHLIVNYAGLLWGTLG